MFEHAERELYERLRQPWQPSDRPVLGRLLHHLMTTDPERAWIAENARAPIAFGMAYARDDFRFLSFLFVRPEVQGKGVGRELLKRCLGERGTLEPQSPLLRATCVDALQPVSTGLYSTFEIVPRVPIFTLLGRSRGPLDVPFADGVHPLRADSTGPDVRRTAVDELDREVLGFTRRVDHDFWAGVGRRLVLYAAESERGSRPLAYGYFQPGGRIGPICVDDPALAPGVVADLVGRLEPLSAWQVTVPGPSSGTLAMLLRSGLRFEGSPAFYSATSSGIDFERYLPAGFALI